MPERATLKLVLASRERRPFVPVGRVQFVVDGGFGAICSVLELLAVGEVLIELLDDPRPVFKVTRVDLERKKAWVQELRPE